MSTDFEVISTYTDANAIADGVIVPISTRDRVTRAVWDFIQERVTSSMVPHNWPMLGPHEARYPYVKEGNALKAFYLCCGLISKYRLKALDVYEKNEEGGIWNAALDHTNDTILGLRPGSNNGLTTLWLMPNELGGVTLMFPSDY